MKIYNAFQRRNTIAGIIAVFFIILIIKIAGLQIFDDSYKKYADSNAFYRKVIFPARGNFYDRNGKLVVYNEPCYDVLITMKEVSSFDTLDFCKVVGISKSDFIKRVEKIKDRHYNPGYSSYTPQILISQLSAKNYGGLQERLFKFKGISVQNRLYRGYKYKVAAHALGYIGEVGEKDIEKDDYYIPGDYNGRSGIERTYEKYLRGEKGVEIMLRDAHGRVKGNFNDGKNDIKPVSGKDLTLSLDIGLQEYAEKLMKNKRGAIVAIEPSTGEILSYVSSPTYDPSLLSGAGFSENYNKLNSSDQKIFLNRPIQSYYPPGSTFKTAQALVLQQEGIVTDKTLLSCHEGYYYTPTRKVGCHKHKSPLALQYAIAISCNGYFCGAYNMMMESNKYGDIHVAMDKWRDYMVSFGFGYKLGIDVPYEKRGMIPNSRFYDKWYGHRGWRGSTIISNAIGQGEVLVTPLQLANLSAMIANRGWFITPHLVKGISGMAIDSLYTKKRCANIDKKYFIPVVNGMRDAVKEGTAVGADLRDIEVCGKTGTAQNSAGKDHSIFMCFAPKDNPKIALLIFIENAGFGATWAVPMGGLIIEKYLRGEIPETRKTVEKRIIDANLL